MRFRFRLGYEVRENLIFTIMCTAFWASYGVYYGFSTLYLRDHGYSEFMCGMITTLMALASLITQPLIGYLTDSYITGKKMLIICFSIAVPLTFVVPLTISFVPMAITSMVALSVFDYNTYSMIDTWVIKLKPNRPYLNFSTIRAGGSIGYAFCTLIFGSMIAQFGYNVMFIAHAALMSVIVICSFLLPEAPCLNVKSQQISESTDQRLGMIDAMKELVKIKEFVIFIVSVIFYQFGMRVTSAYIAIVVSHAGGDSSSLGQALFVSAFGEAIVMFAVSKMIKKGIKSKHLYAMAILFIFIRMFTLGIFVDSVPMIIATQIFQSIGTGLYLCVYVQYIGEIIPRKLVATALTLGSAMGFGIGGVLGTFIGGIMIEQLGMVPFIQLECVAIVLSFVCFMPTLFSKRTKPTTA